MIDKKLVRESPSSVKKKEGQEGGRGAGDRGKKKREKSTYCLISFIDWSISCHVRDNGGGGRTTENWVALGEGQDC